MPDTTPGERAYAAYVRVRYGMPADDAALTYAGSLPVERAAWDAAAQAVAEKAITDLLEVQRILAAAKESPHA